MTNDRSPHELDIEWLMAHYHPAKDLSDIALEDMQERFAESVAKQVAEGKGEKQARLFALSDIEGGE